MFHNPFKRRNKHVGLGRCAYKGKHFFNYRCPESGNYPVDYEVTKFMSGVMEMLSKSLKQRIKDGLVDEYTTPEIFDEYIDAHLQLMRNDIEKQALKHGMSIEMIESQLQTALHMQNAYRSLGEEVLREHDGSITREMEDDHYEK